MNKNRRPGGKENSMKDSIKALRELEKRLYAYQYAMAVADYDSETVAPVSYTHLIIGAGIMVRHRRRSSTPAKHWYLFPAR